MKQTRYTALFFKVVALACMALTAPSPAHAADPPAKAADGQKIEVPSWRDVPDLAGRIKQGGMVFYFRHAATDPNQKDQQPIDLADCAKQRNLSEQGRHQSQAIGAAFRALGITVDQVLSSPFCRTLETSRLAFGRSEKSDMLFFAIGALPADKAKGAAALRGMLSAPPATGKNRVIVSHTANLKDAAGIWPKPEGAAIVFEPRGNDGFRALARIAPNEWPEIVAQSSKPK